MLMIIDYLLVSIFIQNQSIPIPWSIMDKGYIIQMGWIVESYSDIYKSQPCMWMLTWLIRYTLDMIICGGIVSMNDTQEDNLCWYLHHFVYVYHCTSMVALCFSTNLRLFTCLQLSLHSGWDNLTGTSTGT
jgi:hypothetical protein